MQTFAVQRSRLSLRHAARDEPHPAVSGPPFPPIDQMKERDSSGVAPLKCYTLHLEGGVKKTKTKNAAGQ